MSWLDGFSDQDLASLPLRFSEGLFAGKTVVISGAGRGIGRALAFQCVRLGANVAMLGRDEGRLNATAGRRWRDAGRAGSIVSIVAVVSRGMPGVAHSCAARAGVISLSRTLAIEWAPLNIRVNCVAPGIIATEGMSVYSDAARADMPKTNLMKRFGSVSDVTDAICYLAGPSGGFITGEVLTVDGGNQLWGDQWTIERPDYFAQ